MKVIFKKYLTLTWWISLGLILFDIEFVRAALDIPNPDTSFHILFIGDSNSRLLYQSLAETLRYPHLHANKGFFPFHRAINNLNLGPVQHYMNYSKEIDEPLVGSKNGTISSHTSQPVIASNSSSTTSELRLRFDSDLDEVPEYLPLNSTFLDQAVEYAKDCVRNSTLKRKMSTYMWRYRKLRRPNMESTFPEDDNLEHYRKRLCNEKIPIEKRKRERHPKQPQPSDPTNGCGDDGPLTPSTNRIFSWEWQQRRQRFYRKTTNYLREAMCECLRVGCCSDSHAVENRYWSMRSYAKDVSKHKHQKAPNIYLSSIGHATDYSNSGHGYILPWFRELPWHREVEEAWREDEGSSGMISDGSAISLKRKHDALLSEAHSVIANGKAVTSGKDLRKMAFLVSTAFRGWGDDSSVDWIPGSGEWRRFLVDRTDDTSSLYHSTFPQTSIGMTRHNSSHRAGWTISLHRNFTFDDVLDERIVSKRNNTDEGGLLSVGTTAAQSPGQGSQWQLPKTTVDQLVSDNPISKPLTVSQAGCILGNYSCHFQFFDDNGFYDERTFGSASFGHTRPYYYENGMKVKNARAVKLPLRTPEWTPWALDPWDFKWRFFTMVDMLKFMVIPKRPIIGMSPDIVIMNMGLHDFSAKKNPYEFKELFKFVAKQSPLITEEDIENEKRRTQRNRQNRRKRKSSRSVSGKSSESSRFSRESLSRKKKRARIPLIFWATTLKWRDGDIAENGRLEKELCRQFGVRMLDTGLWSESIPAEEWLDNAHADMPVYKHAVNQFVRLILKEMDLAKRFSEAGEPEETSAEAEARRYHSSKGAEDGDHHRGSNSEVPFLEEGSAYDGEDDEEEEPIDPKFAHVDLDPGVYLPYPHRELDHLRKRIVEGQHI